MAGTYGNKNAEKWTEEKALEIGNKMIEWLKQPPRIEIDEKTGYSRIIPSNIFFEYFLAENDFDEGLVSYLSNKFESFSNLVKKAKYYQEKKINEYAVKGILNPTMTIFLLKNHHGYKDKIDQDITSNGESIVPQITILPYKSNDVLLDDPNVIDG